MVFFPLVDPQQGRQKSLEITLYGRGRRPLPEVTRSFPFSGQLLYPFAGFAHRSGGHGFPGAAGPVPICARLIPAVVRELGRTGRKATRVTSIASLITRAVSRSSRSTGSSPPVMTVSRSRNSRRQPASPSILDLEELARLRPRSSACVMPVTWSRAGCAMVGRLG